jgi:hypothetical protein
MFSSRAVCLSLSPPMRTKGDAFIFKRDPMNHYTSFIIMAHKTTQSTELSNSVKYISRIARPIANKIVNFDELQCGGRLLHMLQLRVHIALARPQHERKNTYAATMIRTWADL